MDNKFQWLTRGVEMPRLPFSTLEQWVMKVAESHGRMVGALSYIFCDDDEIIRVNREFLNHDYYTDIITFDDCRGKLLRGDMFISLDTVDTNSVMQGATYREELLRVIIHGVLHLCGINDKGPGEREIMERNENEALDMLRLMNPEVFSQPDRDGRVGERSENSGLTEEEFMERSETEAANLVDRTIREANDELEETAKDF